MKRPEAAGFTLIEVMLAAALLGIGMVVVLFGLSQCLNAIRVSASMPERPRNSTKRPICESM